MLAVVGHNGAGKSTVLKLASGVTRPTEGELRSVRRIAPLIEVGAGFHPELTGRENVEVNARLLGMGRERARRSFDEIVAFAELEHAIDQPVKEYSSGMFMRLGFSVAVHTSPQVLVVDEVLAVGDMPFQVRCLDRIKAMRADGVGILFVSHNLNAVLDLADRAVLLARGAVQAEGDPRDVVGRYYRTMDSGEAALDGAFSGAELEVEVLGATAPDGRAPELWRPRERLALGLRVRARVDVPGVVAGFKLHADGVGVVSAWHQEPGTTVLPALAAGEERDVELGLELDLVPGSYALEVALASPDLATVYAHALSAHRFAVGGPARLGVVDVDPSARALPRPASSPA